MSTVAIEIFDTHVTMCGDRQATQESWGIHAVTKVWRIGDILVGLVGEYAKGLQVVKWLRNGYVPDQFPTEEVKGGDFAILIWDGEQMATLDDQGFFVPVEETRFAVGCGALAARAAMLMGAGPELAINIASQLDGNTGGGSDVIRVDL